MLTKLGDLLVQHGVITQAQLAEGLRAQQLFGGRLGTNLVELGYLSEQGLTKFLSSQLHIPALDSRELDSVPNDALAALPKATAEKYRVVPLSISGRKLRIATAEPTDLNALDEISFATGLTVQPLVAPELLITYALEKYYGITRPIRYVRLMATPEAQLEQMQPMFAEEPRSSSPAHPQSDYDFKQARKDLAEVTQSNDAFDILKRFAAQHFEKAIIFVVRGKRVMGWDQIGSAISKPDLRQVSLDPDENPVLAKAVEAAGAFVGTISPGHSGDWLASQLQVKPDRAAFALSIAVNQQVVSILLASGPRQGEPEDQVDLYAALGQKVSYSLQMVSLRKRILET